MKRLIIAAMMAGLGAGATAQTNIQEMYDIQRGHMTTTIEGFYPDKWGSTYFFNDIYHPTGHNTTTPNGYYTEIARSLNFWKDTRLAPLSLRVEWNGGQHANNAWLFGVEYGLHNKDYTNNLNLILFYKDIRRAKDNIPLQFTLVWNLNDFLGVKGLLFNGFVDVWGEKNVWGTKADGSDDATKVVLLSEPQLWYNVGRHFGCRNLNVGGEVEVTANFAGGWHSGAEWNRNKGLNIAPCLGIKWVF